uniref:Sericin-1-like n=1 Tax=Ascaris lumbricoides TaxID=6252 RepID=A0A0M3IV19_ASCLU
MVCSYLKGVSAGTVSFKCAAVASDVIELKLPDIRMNLLSSSTLVALFVCCTLSIDCECRIFARLKRQTVVSSNAKANGTGENVDTSAISDQYKTSSGIIGMNVSASGAAVGANSSSLEGNAFGSVGNTSVQGTGNAESTGKNSSSSTNINGQIYGGNQSLTSQQMASGSGVGDTSASAVGNGIIQQGGQSSEYSGANNQANAGASGSLSSSSSVVANQTLTWQSILS